MLLSVLGNVVKLILMTVLFYLLWHIHIFPFRGFSSISLKLDSRARASKVTGVPRLRIMWCRNVFIGLVFIGLCAVIGLINWTNNTWTITRHIYSYSTVNIPLVAAHSHLARYCARITISKSIITQERRPELNHHQALPHPTILYNDFCIPAGGGTMLARDVRNSHICRRF